MDYLYIHKTLKAMMYNTERKYVHSILFLKSSRILKTGTHLVCLSNVLILPIPLPMSLSRVQDR